MDLRHGEAERGAVHESGSHRCCFVVGVTVDRVSRIEGAELPDILRTEGSTPLQPRISLNCSTRSNLVANPKCSWRHGCRNSCIRSV